jgi:hypothetical protein
MARTWTVARPVEVIPYARAPEHEVSSCRRRQYSQRPPARSRTRSRIAAFIRYGAFEFRRCQALSLIIEMKSAALISASYSARSVPSGRPHWPAQRAHRFVPEPAERLATRQCAARIRRPNSGSTAPAGYPRRSQRSCRHINTNVLDNRSTKARSLFRAADDSGHFRGAGAPCAYRIRWRPACPGRAETAPAPAGACGRARSCPIRFDDALESSWCRHAAWAYAIWRCTHMQVRHL